jgi:YD repeat-containing protein
VTVLASVTITDGDSTSLSGATVKINTFGQSGDVLGYTAPQGNPITATWDAASKTLTLTGAGTIAQYEEALKAVTFTATQGAALVRGLLINVTDDTGVQSMAPGIATVNVNAAAGPVGEHLGCPELHHRQGSGHTDLVGHDHRW